MRGNIITFQRARSSKQINDRQINIMNSAKIIMRDESIKEVTFSNIAKRTKLSRSSIYKYYKFPEEILANILMVELNSFNSALEKTPVADMNSLVQVIFEQIRSRDLMMQLLAINFSIIKENVRDEDFLKLREEVDHFKHLLANQIKSIDANATNQRILMAQYSLLTMMASIYPLSHDDDYHAKLVHQLNLDPDKPSYEDLLKYQIHAILTMKS